MVLHIHVTVIRPLLCCLTSDDLDNIDVVSQKTSKSALALWIIVSAAHYVSFHELASFVLDLSLFANVS